MPIQLLPDETFLPHLPEILGPFEEFGALRDVSVSAVAAACRHGFMPMGLVYRGEEILLVKCHLQRCVADPAAVHVPANTRRYARGMRLAVDRSPAETLAAIDGVHLDSWLTPRLQAALLDLVGAGVGVGVGVGVDRSGSAAGRVRVFTIELLDDSDGSAVAWEVGYAVGTVYTSLTGAHRRNGSGWVQMIALATLLYEAGFTMWDLGMEIDYKLRLGCRLLAREAFLRAYRTAAGSAAGPATATNGPGGGSHPIGNNRPSVPCPGAGPSLPVGVCGRPATELVAAAARRRGRPEAPTE
jgi:Leu/Phe-tRNA-protein transferase